MRTDAGIAKLSTAGTSRFAVEEDFWPSFEAVVTAVRRSEYLEHAFRKLILFPTTSIFLAKVSERKGGSIAGFRE